MLIFEEDVTLSRNFSKLIFQTPCFNKYNSTAFSIILNLFPSFEIFFLQVMPIENHNLNHKNLSNNIHWYSFYRHQLPCLDLNLFFKVLRIRYQKIYFSGFESVQYFILSHIFYCCLILLMVFLLDLRSFYFIFKLLCLQDFI